MSDRRGQDKLMRDIMEAISVKFILNLPEEEKQEKIRLAYHYQKAYYYYIDQICKEYFPRLNLKKVQPVWVYDRLNQIVTQFMRPLPAEEVLKLMSKSKPTCGAIILNEKQTKVLVVEAGKKLGFPKGGKNENETTQGCAARETKEEVGLFIHSKINPNDKIEFLDRGQVPAIYYIVRNFDENEELRIDRNQIDDAFWMNITDASRQIMRFTSKSRMAWKEFQNKINISPALSMDQFLNIYREKRPKGYAEPIPEINPLLNFRFDTNRLMAVIKQPI